MSTISYILLGLITGLCSGFLGLGGGFVLVPALVFLFGLTQHQAQGTSLAVMVPPITLLAALRYYMGGNVKVDMAIFIALGFAIGGLIGADIVQRVPGPLLKKIFGVVLLFVAVKMITSK